MTPRRARHRANDSILTGNGDAFNSLDKSLHDDGMRPNGYGLPGINNFNTGMTAGFDP